MIEPCLLCGAECEQWLEHRGVSYSFCPRCRLLRKEQFPELAEERARYETHNNSVQDPRYLEYIRGVISADLYPRLKPGDAVLDFGCGSAKAVEALLAGEAPGVEVVSYDPFFHPETPESALAALNRQGFNFIIAIEVFEHLFDPGTAIRRLKNLLVPGGGILLRTMLYPGNRTSFRKWWYKDDLTHVHFFAEETFAWIAQDRGLAQRPGTIPHVRLLGDL